MLSQSTKSQKSKNRASQNIKKLLKAHQKAPLDYISPWDAQHHQILLHNNNSLQSSTKNKNADNRENVVQNFLAKIRKMQSMRKTNRLVRNFSTEQNTVTVTANLQPLTNVSKNGRTQTMARSITFDAADADRFAKMHSEPDDFGFGRLHYSKISAKNDRPPSEKIESTEQKKKKSLTYYRSAADTKISKNQIQYDEINFHTQPVLQNNFVKSGYPQHKSALFTEEELQSPQEVVFIRKKKQNGRLMTVVNINQTAQQFYEEQLRYAEQKMVTKYRKLASKERQIRPKSRVATETRHCSRQEEKNSRQNRVIDRKYMTESDMQGAMDREALKKKYCFLEQLQDESIAMRMQNMLRNHPSLAQSVLIPK